jgi:hypothetical protein
LFNPHADQKGRTLAKTDFVLMDEFRVTIHTARGLPPPKSDAIRQELNGLGFRSDLRRPVRAVMWHRPALEKVRIIVTQ